MISSPLKIEKVEAYWGSQQSTIPYPFWLKGPKAESYKASNIIPADCQCVFQVKYRQEKTTLGKLYPQETLSLKTR